VIEREPTVPSTSVSDKSLGMIRFDLKNGTAAPTSKTILFAPVADESEKSWQNIGDKVQFNLSTDIKTKRQLAVNIKLIETAKEQGFITMLKENYGFIELISKSQRASKTSSMPRDIFFHFSSMQNSINELDVGDEVEFKINRKTRGDQKICAESLVKLKSGTIKPNVKQGLFYRNTRNILICEF
jgi:cold shock CspA family protein